MQFDFSHNTTFCVCGFADARLEGLLLQNDDPQHGRKTGYAPRPCGYTPPGGGRSGREWAAEGRGHQHVLFSLVKFRMSMLTKPRGAS